MIRLNKYLKDHGYCSRREADRWIEAGWVSVNGQVITELGTKVDPESDTVMVSDMGQKRVSNRIYILLNKPLGYVTSTKRTAVEKDIVTDLVDIDTRIFPVGRLDKDTTGMLLLTNDGDFAYQLTHPSFEHEKVYEVTTDKPLTAGQFDKLRKGMVLFGEKTKTTTIVKISAHVFYITLREGKNRQIRRIVRKVGAHVKTLKRIAIGALELGDLPVGSWRYLNADEVNQCMRSEPHDLKPVI